MAYRVAVTSTDGKVVNQHFGHTEQFLVFEVRGEGDFRFLEVRKTKPPCSFGEHDQSTLEEAADLISDCGCVLCSQIGKGAWELLRERGIQVFAIKGYIEEALDQLWVQKSN
jgi:nitrogen fixation protein NifX